MVNKDQIEQTPEGKEVLALMATHFTEEQFQPALTLIQQRYTEDQTVWDANLRHESKLPFLKVTPVRRLLIFFASPDHLVAKIKAELEQRAAEAAMRSEVAQAERAAAASKPKSKSKTYPKARGAAPKARSRKGAPAKTVKRKPRRPQRSKATMKRPKRKSLPAKPRKSRAKKH